MPLSISSAAVHGSVALLADRRRQFVPAVAGAQRASLLAEAVRDDLTQFLAGTERAPFGQLAALLGVLAVREHGVPEVGHALTGRADGGDDRRTPGVVGQVRQVEHLFEVATGLGDAFAIGLVDHEDVGDLHQPGLVRLHAVAPARVDHDDGRVGLAGDLDFDLTDADGLDEHPPPPDRIEEPNGLGRRE